LVREILAAVSRRKNDSALVLFTADRLALEGDEIFVDFLTGEHDVFFVEDADHLLGARSNGNTELHRFLTIADGVVRALGRKIIFTTNLPNIGDIDEALLRPGRSYATVQARALTAAEITLLLHRLVKGDAAAVAGVASRLSRNGKSTATLAEIYQAMRNVKSG
jgi:SpoVK/Ycf46/Vps4 family AAA+-type ATPase